MTNTANGGKVAWNTSPGVTTVTDTASGKHLAVGNRNNTVDLKYKLTDERLIELG